MEKRGLVIGMRISVFAALVTVLTGIMPCVTVHAAPDSRLFPAAMAELEWAEFDAAGFSKPAWGILFTGEKPGCCGVALTWRRKHLPHVLTFRADHRTTPVGPLDRRDRVKERTRNWGQGGGVKGNSMGRSEKTV